MFHVKHKRKKFMEKSKTIWEIFDENYPLNECKENPFICSEAVGFLKALGYFSPALRKECVKRIDKYTFMCYMLALENIEEDIK